MEFRILGPLEVLGDGGVIELGRPQQRAVLAVLLSHRGQTISSDRIIGLLWGEKAPARAASVLQGYIYNLRRSLEPHRPAHARPEVLLTQAPGYRLVVGAEELDAARFEALARQGHRLLGERRVGAARQALVDALALWRGPALAEFAQYPFAEAEGARLEELRQVALEERLEAELALGENAQAAAELEVLVGERPLREHLWELLILALYRCGRQGEALRASAQARRILGEELGIEPGPALRRLEADILAQASSLDWEPTSEVARPGAKTAPSLPPADPRAFVGRQQPLDELVLALARAQAGTAQLALVSGQAGMGKTRLIEELSARAAEQGTVVAWGRGYEGEGAPAFWPLVQVIEAVLDELDPEGAVRAAGREAGEIAQIAPAVADRVGGLAPPPPLDAASARFHLGQAVAAFLRRAASVRPLLVVLDDVHWADVASLELIRFLATQIGSAPVFIVATYRPEDVPADHPLTSTLADLARFPSLTRPVLKGLNEDEVALLIAQITGWKPSPTVVSAVYERTDGNPFFVVELARLLAAEGASASLGDASTAVPPGVRDVIRRRLSRLPEAATHLLAIASVLNCDFDLALLAEAAETEQAAALELIDQAVAAAVVREVPGALGSYRFSHAVIRDTVYSELPGARRAHLHARAAEVLASRSGDDHVRAVALAHHWFLAAPLAGPEPALAALLQAAEMAEARLAFEHAEGQLRRALELLQRLPLGPERSRRELAVQNRLGAVVVGRRGIASGSATEVWERARALSDAVGTTANLLPSLWGPFTRSLSRLDLQHAMEQAHQLVELSRTDAGAPFRVAAGLGPALVEFHTGRLVAARQHFEEALLACEALDDPAALAGSFIVNPVVMSRSWLALALWLLGDTQKAWEVSGESLAIARQGRHRPSLACPLLHDAWLSVWEGDPSSVRQRVREIQAVAGEFQDAVPMTMILSAWAGGAEDYARAHTEGRAALDAQVAEGFKVFTTLYLGSLVDLHLRAHEPEAALATADEALAQVEVTGERFFEAELCRLRAEAVLGACPHSRDEGEWWLRRAIAVADSQLASSLRRRAEATLARVERQHELRVS